jgi:hypothetical protein
MNHLTKQLLILVAISMPGLCLAEGVSSIESHCKEGEFSYLNANMAELRYPIYETEEERRTKPVWILQRTGKFLSICTDRQKEPFSSVTYRYGEIGDIEFEKIATKSSPFYVFERGISPHVGEAVFFFKSGQYTYCVIEATAQGSGISLTVLKAGKEIVSLFSGNDQGADYEAGLLEISFGSSRSPVLKAFPLPLNDPFQTPCDGKRLMRP